jgi:hypothetical protein
MPFCENCGNPIMGNFCQRCGWNAAQMPSQPVQKPQQYQQPQPQYLGPQRRSRAPIVIGVIVIVAIIILALMFFLVLNPEDEGEVKEMTQREFMEDYEDSDGDGDIDNLKSLNPGDKVRISDKVADIHYDYDADMTLIQCESAEDLELSLAIVLDGDQSDRYEIGDPISVTLHIKRYEINGKSVELPKEFYSYLLEIGTMDETTTSPTGAFDFSETSTGNYTGGLVSLSSEVKLEDCSWTIIDVSTGASASQGPPIISGTPVQAGRGLKLTFTDANSNEKVDAGDVITLENAAEGDQIRLIHDTGKSIAAYTIP